MGSARIAISSAVAALAFAGLATAGSPPGVEIVVNVTGNAQQNYFPAGSPIGGGNYSYSGNNFADLLDYDATWDFIGSNSEEAFYTLLSGNFTFTNNSDEKQFYDVWVILDVTATDDPTKVGGSVAAGMTANEDGGSFGTIDNESPLWSAYMDNTFVAGLIYDDSVSADPFESEPLGSAAFGQPIPDMDGGPLGNTVSIRLQFSLTPGDQASFTSVFVLQVVPAPAGFALLGIAALGRRRRV